MMILKRLLWLLWWPIFLIGFILAALFSPLVWTLIGKNIMLIWMEDFEPVEVAKRWGIFTQDA